MPAHEPAPPIPPTDRDLLEAFLASRDVPCPRCGHNLRGNSADRCPECGQRLVLNLSDSDPRTTWDTLALFAVVLTVLYFAVRTSDRIIKLAAGVNRGTSLVPLRVDNAVNATIEIIIALGGSVWCLAIIRNRTRRPRPIWARPTTVASGLLLAVFVAFLLAYGIRALL